MNTQYITISIDPESTQEMLQLIERKKDGDTFIAPPVAMSILIASQQESLSISPISIGFHPDDANQINIMTVFDSFHHSVLYEIEMSEETSNRDFFPKLYTAALHQAYMIVHSNRQLIGNAQDGVLMYSMTLDADEILHDMTVQTILFDAEEIFLKQPDDIQKTVQEQTKYMIQGEANQSPLMQ
ncbi:MAG: hypothetical protein U9Q15_04265 [Patescibacteria group bacterium]|nr:hypothetical protein [Patescibacteria group bacterium]